MREQEYFKGKRIWISGASRGIGEALAIRLSSFDTKLALSARNGDDLEKVRQRCENSETIMVVPADVSTLVSNNEIAAKIQENFGGIDIVILNAGTAEYIDMHNFKSEVFERLIKINFLSMIYGIEAFLPLLRQSSCPHIVGVSSIAAYGGMPRSEAYGASKAAARNMLSALRISLSVDDVTVSTVCPGFVKTSLTDKNDFPMPMLINADEAAQLITKGVANQSEEIHFPKRFSLLMKLITSLPSPLYTQLMKRLVLRK